MAIFSSAMSLREIPIVLPRHSHDPMKSFGGGGDAIWRFILYSVYMGFAVASDSETEKNGVVWGAEVAGRDWREGGRVCVAGTFIGSYLAGVAL